MTDRRTNAGVPATTFATFLLASAAALAAAGGVLMDDFDDGVIGDLWTVTETDPGTIRVFERNNRLEFPVSAGDQPGAGAALLANGWGIDSNADFQLRVDAHADLPDLDGDVSIELIFVYDIDLDAEEVIYGVAVLLGKDADGPYIGYEVSRDGAVVDDAFVSAPGTDATFYLWYDADADVLAFSAAGYFAGDATLVEGMRTQSEVTAPYVILGAFAEGPVPGSSGDALFLDNFVVDAGLIVSTGCAPDFDGSGTVDVGDLIALLAAWGDCPGCPEDLTGDDVVNVGDLIALLAAWGVC